MPDAVRKHVVGDALLEELEHHFDELCAAWGTEHTGQWGREMHRSGGLANGAGGCVHLLNTCLLTRRRLWGHSRNIVNGGRLSSSGGRGRRRWALGCRRCLRGVRCLRSLRGRVEGLGLCASELITGAACDYNRSRLQWRGHLCIPVSPDCGRLDEVRGIERSAALHARRALDADHKRLLATTVIHQVLEHRTGENVMIHVLVNVLVQYSSTQFTLKQKKKVRPPRVWWVSSRVHWPTGRLAYRG